MLIARTLEFIPQFFCLNSLYSSILSKSTPLGFVVPRPSGNATWGAGILLPSLNLADVPDGTIGRRMVSNAQYATGERGFEQRCLFFTNIFTSAILPTNIRLHASLFDGRSELEISLASQWDDQISTEFSYEHHAAQLD